MVTFSVNLTNLTAPLPQSHDCNCCVSRLTLAPPPLQLHKHSDLRAYDFEHSPDMWHQPKLANVVCAWGWRLCWINPAIAFHHTTRYHIQRHSNLQSPTRTSQISVLQDLYHCRNYHRHFKSQINNRIFKAISHIFYLSNELVKA